MPIAVDIRKAGSVVTSAFPIDSKREGLHRVERSEPVVGNPHENSAGEIEGDDQERRDRVAFDKLSRAIHRSVEIRFLLHGFALAARAIGVQGAGVHVGVDRHLLPRHRVERKASGHFGNALRTAGDDDELDCHQDRKDDDTDDQVSTNDERSECWNDRADGARRCSVRKDEPGRRNIEREPKEGCDEERRREGRELERIVNRDGKQEHERRSEDVDAEQEIEQPRRQRHDQNRDDRQQQSRKDIDRALMRAHHAISSARSNAATTSATAR